MPHPATLALRQTCDGLQAARDLWSCRKSSMQRGARLVSHLGWPLRPVRPSYHVRSEYPTSHLAACMHWYETAESKTVDSLSPNFCSASTSSMTAFLLFGAERFPHLRLVIDQEWRTFGRDKGTAKAELIELAEQLGCRDSQFHPARHEAVSLARGSARILAAIERAGGVQALAAADPDAAACLGCGLMLAAGDKRRRWLPSDVIRRVEEAFKSMGPGELRTAAAGIRAGVPTSLHRACVAISLTEKCLQAADGSSGPGANAEGHMQETAASTHQVGRQAHTLFSQSRGMLPSQSSCVYFPPHAAGQCYRFCTSAAGLTHLKHAWRKLWS